ncbi:hypothetical protein AB0K67_39580 [Nonomuraea sp. NPDC052634]|jgi:hypothetical protein|uniref:hypothetical protein n=1 Tax=Nonomuraea sp. NPDC052634 TaxID=3155813 RepID=UPI00342561BE
MQRVQGVPPRRNSCPIEDQIISEISQRGGETPLRDLLGDHLLDLLLERSRDGSGGLRPTGESSVLGRPVKAVLERALETELIRQQPLKLRASARGPGTCAITSWRSSPRVPRVAGS